ncbi:hypothetical protein R5R35_009166 [Gryllus longicercus]|uniref:Uncharacterized protein n=1 Tax=Gryllus longicercus TaxID=2509291 RepID=A0AAN9VDT1_9ORTH
MGNKILDIDCQKISFTSNIVYNEIRFACDSWKFHSPQPSDSGDKLHIICAKFLVLQKCKTSKINMGILY